MCIETHAARITSCPKWTDAHSRLSGNNRAKENLWLVSTQLADYASHHAIEQRRFGRDSNFNDSNHVEADQAPKLGSRTLLDGFSQLVDEEKAAPERTDVGQLGRSARLVPVFLAKFHPHSFLEVLDEFDFVRRAFGARCAGRVRVIGIQFLHVDLSTPERILDGEALGEIQ